MLPTSTLRPACNKMLVQGAFLTKEAPVVPSPSVEEKGYFSGYASVFDVIDGQRDCIRYGAFSQCLKEKPREDIKLLWQHQIDKPIGYIRTLHEDVRGLKIEGRLLLQIPFVRDIYYLLQAKAIKGLSIGYNIRSSYTEPLSGIQYISNIDLWEISLVTFPANQEAVVAEVKAK